ncbi:terminase [Gryllotalpicola protaetiae]|uniref:Terminase n=1 Tax=Gryllotalpicola protaetiae TaxID=2419771 RepID=A0A387BN10_9MICO|nr:terminase [Gryllotalpicola protaetiae]AYG02377.1 terminase [Gryllotalpicola protaetiae]
MPPAFDAGLSEARLDDLLGVSFAAGLVFDPWQELGAEGMTRTRSDGKWSAFEVGLQANRQNGKGALLEGRQLAGLFVWNESLQVHTAHEFKTAQEHFLRLRHLIEDTPTLDRLVARVRTASGEEAIETKSGCRLRFMARSTGSGRGLAGDVVYLDEAYRLRQAMMAALLPTMAAKSLDGNPQLFYTSSAGMLDSDVQEALRARGIVGDERLMYAEWSVPDDADPDDPENWRRANPAFGIRISEEFIASMRAAMGDEEFKREHLGIWAKVGGEQTIPPAAWDAGFADDLGGVPVARLALAVDVPPARDSAVIGLAARLEDGRTMVEVAAQEPGIGWVPDRLAAIRRAMHPVAVVVDAAGAAGTIMPELRQRHVRTMQIGYRDLGVACGRFYDMVLAGRLAHSGQAPLDEAVAVATRTPIGDSLWKWNRKTKAGNISPLVAVTLALHGLEAKAHTGDQLRSKVVVLS